MKIVIIEDHKLIRNMLALSCGRILPAAELNLAEDGASGLELCRRVRPELIFLDLVLPDWDGLELLPEIFEASPASKVIALTSFADEFTVHRISRASVHGFIAKNEQPLDLLKEAVETVMAGGQYFSPVVQKLKSVLRSDPASFDKVLSEHEQRLLGFFGEGLSNEAVAMRIGLECEHGEGSPPQYPRQTQPAQHARAADALRVGKRFFTRVGFNRSESRKSPF